MPLSLLARIWLSCVTLGAILLFFSTTRKLAYFLIFVPTGAAIASFVLTIAVYFFLPQFVAPTNPTWLAPAVDATYVIALLFGPLVGGLIAFWLTRKLIARL